MTRIIFVITMTWCSAEVHGSTQNIYVAYWCASYPTNSSVAEASALQFKFFCSWQQMLDIVGNYFAWISDANQRKITRERFCFHDLLLLFAKQIPHLLHTSLQQSTDNIAAHRRCIPRLRRFVDLSFLTCITVQFNQRRIYPSLVKMSEIQHETIKGQWNAAAIPVPYC